MMGIFDGLERWLTRLRHGSSGDEGMTESELLRIFAEVRDQALQESNDRMRLGAIEDFSEFEARKNDLEYQLALIRPMISEGRVLPAPFERAVILLSKARRHEEELEVCLYVRRWCDWARANYAPDWYPHWRSLALQRILARIPKIEKKLQGSRGTVTVMARPKVQVRCDLVVNTVLVRASSTFSPIKTAEFKVNLRCDACGGADLLVPIQPDPSSSVTCMACGDHVVHWRDFVQAVMAKATSEADDILR